MKRKMDLPVPESIRDKWGMWEVLFLDDDMTRWSQFPAVLRHKGVNLTMVSEAEEAIAEMEQKQFNLIFLDHDLGGQVFVDNTKFVTGLKVARWLEEHPEYLSKVMKVVIHSMNPVGSADMLNCLGTKGIILPWHLLLYNSVDIPYKPKEVGG